MLYPNAQLTVLQFHVHLWKVQVILIFTLYVYSSLRLNLYILVIYIYIRFTFEFLIYIALLQVTMQHVSFVPITDGENQEMFKVASIYFLP